MIKEGLIKQYLAGLDQLAGSIAQCPEEEWTAGIHPRATWRIVYHALFYTHLYLMPTQHDFKPWEKHVWHAPLLWLDDSQGAPPEEHPYTKKDLAEYCDWLRSQVPALVEALDLEAPKSGFSWYRIGKMEHQIVNIRHLGVHVGQVQERLLARGIEPGWISTAKV